MFPLSNSPSLRKDVGPYAVDFHLFSFLGFLPRVPSHIVWEELLGWHGTIVGKTYKKTWFVVPLCIVWIVWKQRNSIAFEDMNFFIKRMKNCCV